MTRSNDSQSAGQTQSQRRLRYGSNVAVAIIAAVLIVIGINVIAHSKLGAIRRDFTATRQYSLSEQTRQVMRDLKKDFRIVTLLPAGNPNIDRARDLVDEYAHAGKRISVEHIDPLMDISRLEKFYADLQSRYQAELDPVDKAIKAGLDAMKEQAAMAQEQMKALEPAVKAEEIAGTQVKRLVDDVVRALARFESDSGQIVKEVDKALKGSLPNYRGAIDAMKQMLERRDENLLAVAIEQFNLVVKEPKTPAKVKDVLLKLADDFARSRKAMEQPLAALRQAKTPESYDKLIGQLASRSSVVLLGNDQVRVVQLEEMFRNPTEQEVQLDPSQQPELRFLGEERITGALLAMSLEHQPLVVFVGSGRMQALGQQGMYRTVAERLQNMNFEVKEWSPGGKANPMTGQPMPGGPPPEPKEGQKAVWIVLPVEPANPMMGMPQTGGAEEIANHVSERMTHGDGAMILATASPFGAPDPLVEIAASFGISIKNDRLIFRETKIDDRRVQPDPTLLINEWPGDLSVSKAIGSMQGVFFRSCPVELGGKDDKELKTYPLAVIRDKRMWAHKDLMGQAVPAFDRDSAADAFTLLAAAERGNNRLIASGDMIWATDQVTSLGALGPGTAHIVGAQFPANSELFVNSVYWLSGMDHLIAASARTQDIRRITDLTADRRVVLMWSTVLLLPLGTLAVGLGVWFLRRT